ncbi:Poly (ADP-ribose) polymerase [Mactra antiquata]
MMDFLVHLDKFTEEITARVTVSASTQTARDAAHHQFLESVKSCVPRGHDKQHNDEVFTACNNLFTSMSKDDISLQQVEEGSVLITFRCLTWTGLKNAILYLTKPLWIGELENVLSRSVNSCVKLNVNIVLETLISTLDSAEQCTNEKSVVLTLNCKGSKGVRNAVSYLINGSSTNTVNNISEALSRSVGERIELHTTIDVDKLEKEMKKMKHLYGYQDDMRSLTLSSFAKENIVKINNMTICLVKGDIAQQKVDVMVNTTNKSLDLKVGSVSGAILEFGQQDIQHEAYAKYREGITDDIAQTKGHKLNCQMVLHLALAKWVESKYSNDEKVMTLCDKVSKCLDVAKRSRYASIAFPAVGCGHLGYPSDLVARLMLDRFHRHAEDETVKDVRIVIHELDKKTFRASIFCLIIVPKIRLLTENKQIKTGVKSEKIFLKQLFQRNSLNPAC